MAQSPVGCFCHSESSSHQGLCSQGHMDAVQHIKGSLRAQGGCGREREIPPGKMAFHFPISTAFRQDYLYLT